MKNNTDATFELKDYTTAEKLTERLSELYIEEQKFGVALYLQRRGDLCVVVYRGEEKHRGTDLTAAVEAYNYYASLGYAVFCANR